MRTNITYENHKKMTNNQLLSFLYRKVCLNEGLSIDEEQQLQRWKEQSNANAQAYIVLSDRRSLNVSFNERHKVVVTLVSCIACLIIGAMLSQVTLQRTQTGLRHPYAVSIPDSAWKWIDNYAHAKGMVASYNNLGVLSFRLVDDTASMLTAPIICKVQKMDSMGFQIYQDVIEDRHSFLNMVVSRITIEHGHPVSVLGGNPDYTGIYSYSTEAFGLRVEEMKNKK